MRTSIAIVVLALASPAAAGKPLPATIKPTIKDGAASVQIQGISVSLPTDDRLDQARKIELSDDGASLIVTFHPGMADDTDPDKTSTFPLAHLEAEVENKLGMQLHLKKKYEDAIKHFTLAASKAPTTPVYATNLLSAQSLAKKLTDADQTLATYGAKNVAWFVWRLEVDPELKNVKARRAAKALGAAKVGHAKAIDVEAGYAYSRLGDGLVVMSVDTGATYMVSANDLVVIDAKTANEILRLPILKIEDGCAMGECPKAAKAAQATRRKSADRILALLGFEIVAKSWSGSSDDPQAVSPDKSVTITWKDGAKVVITHGKASKTYDRDTADLDIRTVGFVPTGILVLNRLHKDNGGDYLDATWDILPIP